MNWKKNHQAEYFNVRGEAPIVFLSGTLSLARFRKVFKKDMFYQRKWKDNSLISSKITIYQCTEAVGACLHLCHPIRSKAKASQVRKVFV